MSSSASRGPHVLGAYLWTGVALSRIGSTIVMPLFRSFDAPSRQANLDVVHVGLGILDEHVEIAILVEHTGVDQLVLEFLARATAGDEMLRLGVIR